MSRFARVAGRLFNTPLMLRPEKAEMLCAALVDRIGIAKLDRIDGTSLGVVEMRGMAEEATQGPRYDRRGFYLEGDVAIIRIDGTLSHKLGGVDPWSGLVGFDQITSMVNSARNDESISAILIDMDSPGGETAGCFECADNIFRSSARFGGKPVFAFANEMSCSAAYAIAAACDGIATTTTGVIGSIGVWTMIVDMTKGLDKNGIDVRMIRAGERKARGGPYETPDDATIAKLQAWVDETWVLFAKKVAEYRGLDAQAILDLAGDWFTAPDALDQHLVDAIDTPAAIYDAVAELGREWRAKRQ